MILCLKGVRMEFFKAVYLKVQEIPAGKVATYGDIAHAVGKPHMARQVGWALHANPTPILVPCHRVVNREGRLAAAFKFGGLESQERLLKEEGVAVHNHTVDLEKYRHRF